MKNKMSRNKMWNQCEIFKSRRDGAMPLKDRENDDPPVYSNSNPLVNL